ncbi:telomere length regulation protein TEL2 homolog isoform X4 [Hypanus sabinus]|uniref:telomere length regulation protein TEL2 homolog isoform X4 n=1 Tax=Hypanus sabinus TaxID=79690 RepID=UPI0028C4E79B|nr:telomere length regulation protein TEL2 homolog isoform X4 [Hypanus sabinus]
MFEICAGMSRGRVAANGIGPAESPVFGSPLLVPSGTEILSPMEAEVLQSHSFVRQALGTLSSSRDGAEITHILQAMRQYLEPTEGERSPQSQEFLNMHYPRFLQVLVSNLQADWLQLLPNNQQRELLDGFFLDGPPLHAYLVLLDAVTLASPGFRQNRSVEILERFLREHRMAELIWEAVRTVPSPSSLSYWGRSAFRDTVTVFWECWCPSLLSLPSPIASGGGSAGDWWSVYQSVGWRACCLVWSRERKDVCPTKPAGIPGQGGDSGHPVNRELLSLMTGGVDCHLDSSLVRVRRLGMVVAECISAKVDTREYRLTFQYEDDDEVREIRSLCTPRPLSSWESPPQPHRNGESQTDTRQEATESRGSNQTETESELDSDDELVPYDLSADSELCRSQAPVYVGDCLEVLLASDNPERVEGSLKILEDLIRKNPNAAREVSVELTKVLLHLEDKFGIVGFTGLRQRALVALTVTSVVPVTQYLTSEFYAVNYSLSQRMDILDVLVLSAQELAQPGPAAGSPSDESADPFLQVQHRVASDPSRHWKQIIEQRLQNKTRRFSKGWLKPRHQASPNRLGPVAGHFFFPLINNYDRPKAAYDFLSEPLMLGRLTHSLAVLVYLSVNVPIIISMGMALLGFTWALRYHPDTYVRQGTLFGFSSLLLTIPSDRLLADVPDELLEARSWLADVAENDPDAECRRLALQNLLLMENLKKNLGICSE